MDQEMLPIPGLDPPRRGESALQAAVVTTLRALAADHLLTDKDAARCALAAKLAQIIEEKHRSGRMSTVGNDARVLAELLDGLAPAQTTEVDAALKAALAEWGTIERSNP